jgi:hypothetical protein
MLQRDRGQQLIVYTAEKQHEHTRGQQEGLERVVEGARKGAEAQMGGEGGEEDEDA